MTKTGLTAIAYSVRKERMEDAAGVTSSFHFIRLLNHMDVAVKRIYIFMSHGEHNKIQIKKREKNKKEEKNRQIRHWNAIHWINISKCHHLLPPRKMLEKQDSQEEYAICLDNIAACV